jgi:P pilus assembly chaperone PapD
MVYIRLFFLSAFVFLLINDVYPQGNLLVTPVRVIFENNKVREDLNVTNIGQDTAVYLISFLKYRMNENGSFTELNREDSTVASAEELLRIFPRRVKLPPNESQVIRMQYRKPADLPTGEYRSHLYFRAEKNLIPLGLEQQKSDTARMSVRITPIFGISIPIIVRNGNLSHKMSISDVNVNPVNDSLMHMSLMLNRQGDRSAYGNLKVVYHPEKAKPVEVAIANGVGVYTEINKRSFSMPLRLTDGLRFGPGKLVITYLTPYDDGNKELAKTEYIIAN